MISDKFIFIAALLGVAGSISYAITVIKGNTKPNRVTWLLWAVIPMVAFFAQIDEGVGLVSLMTFMAGFGPLIVLMASFLNKEASWKISKLDITCGSLSVIAIALWIYTGSGNLAIGLTIGADLLAAVPTIHKSFVYPETEHTSAFRNAMFGAVIALLIIDDWNFANYSFALYIFIITSILYLLIKFRIGKRILVRIRY